MSQEVGEEIGSKLGRFIEVDRRLWQSDQAKFMRVRVNLEIDKPLRRGVYITSSDGECLLSASSVGSSGMIIDGESKMHKSYFVHMGRP